LQRRVFASPLVTTPTPDCELGDQFKACLDENDRQFKKHMTWGAVALGASAVSFSIAAWYHYHQQPVSETEAKQMAAEHNRKLREKLGLPLDVEVAPYVSATGGGLSISGGF